MTISPDADDYHICLELKSLFTTFKRLDSLAVNGLDCVEVAGSTPARGKYDEYEVLGMCWYIYLSISIRCLAPMVHRLVA